MTDPCNVIPRKFPNSKPFNNNNNNNGLKERPHKKAGSSWQRRKPNHNNTKTTTTTTKVQCLKFHSDTATTTPVELLQHKTLDPSIPEQAQKLRQRQKMILYGKNTVGYDLYCQQVPRDKRRPRSMDTPMTPDHTLDIPNKRWLGQVRAWRRALHEYDPPDLQKCITIAAREAAANQKQVKEQPKKHIQPLTVQEQELCQAKSTGLLVDFGNTTNTTTSSSSVSPTSVTAIMAPDLETAAATGFHHMTEDDELDQWERSNNNTTDTFVASDDDDDDSDDDLL